MKPAHVSSITTNLIVEEIERCLPFWCERLGFEQTVAVPHHDKLGFVILRRGELELMMQSRASLVEDMPWVAPSPCRAMLFLRVDDLAPFRAALAGWPLLVDGRKTFYGTEEIILDDPAGNVVCLAARAAATSEGDHA